MVRRSSERKDHSRCENACKHLCFGTNEAVVHGYGVMVRCCASAGKCVKHLRVLSRIFG